MNILIIFSLLNLMSLSFAQVQTGQTLPQTNSHKFVWLEDDNLGTQDFRATAKKEVESLLAKSSNFPKIENFLLTRFPADLASINEVKVDETRKIVHSRKNYHSVFVDRVDGVDREIFSTESLQPRLAEVANLVLSPTKKFLVIQLQLDGNIDFSRYIIYDLELKKITGQFSGLSFMRQPLWNSNYEMITMHPDSSPPKTSAMIVDLRTFASQVTPDRYVYKMKDWVSITSPSKNSGRLTNFKTGESFHINTHITFLNDVEETAEAFYYIEHEHTDGTVFRLNKQDFAKPMSFIPPREGYWVSSLQLLDNKFLLVNYSRDSLVTLVLYNLQTGNKLSELSLPDNYDFTEAVYQSTEEKLSLSLYNFLGQSFNVIWDIQNSEQTDLSQLPNKFELSGLEFVSKLEFFKSHDGESIPARITYLKNSNLNGNNPTYVETYGAFNYISFYLFPALNRMKLEFLKRGGILVGTGVRGGAERGYSWYLNGTAKNKANAALDLVAVANGLVNSGYTKGDRIVSTGISAGGDNVAAAAQLSPSSFGLVIPISGIHDHFGFLRMDRWGTQWLFDYLDPRKSEDFSSIYARSPLEIRTKSAKYPEYFIVCGESDTRASSVHSFKLKASLNEFHKTPVYLYAAEGSGHWPNESSLHGRQGVKTNAAIWARVFDYFNLNFDLRK